MVSLHIFVISAITAAVQWQVAAALPAYTTQVGVDNVIPVTSVISIPYVISRDRALSQNIEDHGPTSALFKWVIEAEPTPSSTTPLQPDATQGCSASTITMLAAVNAPIPVQDATSLKVLRILFGLSIATCVCVSFIFILLLCFCVAFRFYIVRYLIERDASNPEEKR